MAFASLAHAYAWLAGFGEEPEYYQKGIDAATEVIQSGDYSLVNNPHEICEIVLPGNSQEGIFEIDFLKRFTGCHSKMAGRSERHPLDKENLTPFE